MSADDDLAIAHLTEVELIGHGGFSWVYAATDTQLRRRVAVKLLNEIKTDTDRRRFDRECEILGKLSSHPHIVTVFAAGYTDHNRPYLIMELVSGGSIDDLLASQGAVGWQDAVDVTLAVAGALQAAHGQGVLHRDIKPENILLEGREPRLADFGIALLRDSAGATSTKITASWLHAPPETFENRRDERSDLYSLASTLYTMISGTAPFWRPGEDSLNPLVLRLMSEQVAPLDPALAPAPLNALILSTMAKDPAQRPQSAAHFAAELVALRSGTVAPGALTGPAPGPAPYPAQAPASAPTLTPNLGVGSPAGATQVASPGPTPAATLAPGLQAPADAPSGGRQAPRSNLAMFAVGMLGVVVLGGIIAVGALALGRGGDGDGEEATSDTPSVDALVDADPSGPGAATDTVTSTGTVGSTIAPAPTTASTTAPTAAAPVPVEQATLLTGTWQGTYVCSQGSTGLTLSMAAEPDGSVRALFDFYSIPENPGVPPGSFTMNGQHSPGRLDLIADQWVRRPPDFVTADLSAQLGGPRDDLISGAISTPSSSCTVFTVEKIDDELVEIPE